MIDYTEKRHCYRKSYEKEVLRMGKNDLRHTRAITLFVANMASTPPLHTLLSFASSERPRSGPQICCRMTMFSDHGQSGVQFDRIDF